MAKHQRPSLVTAGNRYVLYLVLFLGIVFTVSSVAVNTAHASPVVGFNAGRIIDDFIFTNSTSMNTAQIQAFLNSKVATCDTNGTQIASEYGSNLTHAQYAASRGWSAPPYTCLKDYSENGISAAQIIYNMAQQYKINPQVLIVLLQKEQGLVTDTWPLSTQYRTATGYGCPDTSVCNTQYYGFTNQLHWSGTMFRAILDNSSTWFSPYILGNNTVYYNPGPYNNSTKTYYGQYGTKPDITYCGSSTVNIQNMATVALYDYTPYQPNQASLDAGYGSAGLCGAYGNRNFFLYFTDWFGATYAYIYNGISYTDVFNAQYYLNKYPDVLAIYGSDSLKAFKHFIDYGMSEGRQGSANFDVVAYRNGNADLRWAYETNLPSYYWHYIVVGQKEGRSAISPAALQPVSIYGGVDYSAIYDFNTYLANNGDLRAAYNNDDTGALWHFVTVGMGEGRVANSTFDATSYKKRYPDLRNAFGNNIRLYYLHYMSTGNAEHRIATGDFLGGTTVLNSVNYSAVYNPDFYQRQNPDIQKAFGTDDVAMLRHFVNYGMAEGRQGNDTFNVSVYKSTYGDLRIAFGNNLKDYYMHYITTGQFEGRTAI